MKFNETKIEGLYIANLQPYIDNRGFFVRSYCNKELENIGITKPFFYIKSRCNSWDALSKSSIFRN